VRLLLRDFRVGVGLLIVIMPIAQSYAFPHAMFGITGLNPLNLLLATTLGVYLMRAMGSSSVRHLVPWQLFVLYLCRSSWERRSAPSTSTRSPPRTRRWT
jgi:hypothetical protein